MPPRIAPSPFRSVTAGRKGFFHYPSKAQGEPCKPGETAASTGCIPANKEAGSPSSPAAETKKPRRMYRGTGAGADTTSGFEWFSETESLAGKYADYRGGTIHEAAINVEKPFELNKNEKLHLTPNSFFALATKQVDPSKLDRQKVLEARNAFLQAFGDKSRDLVDYWSNPEAKEATRNLLEAMGFDGIALIEGGEQTVATFRAEQIQRDKPLAPESNDLQEVISGKRKPTFEEYQQLLDDGYEFTEEGWRKPDTVQLQKSREVSKQEHEEASANLHPEERQLIEYASDWEETKPWLMTEEQIQTNPPPGIRFNRNPRGEEAIYQGGTIYLSPKFFQIKSEEGRRHILYHELGHVLADTMVKDGTSFRLHDSEVIPSQHEMGSGVIGGHGDEEALADSYATLFTDPQWLENKYPDMARIVKDRAFAMNMPLPKNNTTKALLYPPKPDELELEGMPQHLSQRLLSWENEPQPDLDGLIEVPDIRQPDKYSCGACAAFCVGSYYGVGPESLKEWKKELGTTIEESTRPGAIADYLDSLGLEVIAHGGMTVEDLERFWQAGWPVIVCCQDYGSRVPKKARFAYGHYLTFIGGPIGGYLFFQDSSEDNITQGSESIQAPGKIMVKVEDFLEAWHDRDIEGEEYLQFGIAVGPPIPSFLKTKSLEWEEKALSPDEADAVEDNLRRVCESFADIPGDHGPDYQQLYWNPQEQEVWWVSADGDDSAAVDEIFSRLEQVVGVWNVRGEAETPPRGKGWEKVWPVEEKGLPDYRVKEGFSGIKKDKLGRTRCYVNGKLVSCPDKVSSAETQEVQSPSQKRSTKIYISETPVPIPPEDIPSEKAVRSKASHKMVDKVIQRYAEEFNEPQFAELMGGKSYPDSEPIDVDTSSGDGVELKTMVDNSNKKLTMDTYSQIRKILWEKEHQRPFHTVVIDDHEVFNAKGPGIHDQSKRVYYYRRGVAGSARVGNMYRCESIEELKKLMAMPEKSLPDEAQRKDTKLRIGKWKPFQDEFGKGFLNMKTGQRVRAKK